MSLQRDIIWNGLQELSDATAANRECWVTFKANENEHWVQCTPVRINMDWPFSACPAENGKLNKLFSPEAELEIDSWKPDTFVTFRPTLKDVYALVSAIDNTFGDLYSLGPDYFLAYELEGG